MITHRLAYILLLIMFLLGLGTAFYSYEEGWNYIDGVYFSAMTLTTIGYGDLYPTTTASKLFTVFYSIFGVAVMLYFVTVVIGQYLSRQESYFDGVISTLHHVSPKRLVKLFGTAQRPKKVIEEVTVSNKKAAKKRSKPRKRKS